MAGDASVLTEHMGSSNDMGIGCNNLLHLSIPFAGVFAVGSYKFLNREMLARAMPIHISIGLEVFSYLDCSLCKNVRPKLLYVHYITLSLGGEMISRIAAIV